MSRSAPLKVLTANDMRARKSGDPLACLTAYTTPLARMPIPECDVVLVGDSVDMVMHGLSLTVGVTMEMMVLRGRSATRGLTPAFMVVDMPFGSYEESLA